MTEQWIDQVLPALDPSPVFVRDLRAALDEGWSGRPAVVRSAPDVRAKASRRSAWLVSAATIALVAGGVATLARRGGSSPSGGATIAQAVPSDVLSAHRWVTGQFGVERAGLAWVEFDTALKQITFFDGCTLRHWSFMLDGAHLRVPDAASTDTCFAELASTMASATLGTESAEGATTLSLVPDDQNQLAFTLEALDEQPPAGGDELAGTWTVNSADDTVIEPAHGVVRLGADGSVGVGYCDGLGSWAAPNGALHLEVADPDYAVACSGADQRPGLTSLLDGTFSVRRHGDAGFYLSNGDTVLALRAARFAPDDDVLDLADDTLYGFTVGATVSAERLIGVIAGWRGTPTFDTGWYAPPASEACAADVRWRVVQWGDLAVGLAQNGSGERVRAWSLGSDATAEAALYAASPALAPGTPSGVSSRPPQSIGVGTPLSRLAGLKNADINGAFATAELTLHDGLGKVTTGVDQAVAGTWRVGATTLDLRASGGVLTYLASRPADNCAVN